MISAVQTRHTKKCMGAGKPALSGCQKSLFDTLNVASPPKRTCNENIIFLCGFAAWPENNKGSGLSAGSAE